MSLTAGLCEEEVPTMRGKTLLRVNLEMLVSG